MRERDICKVEENDKYVHFTYTPVHFDREAESLCGRPVYSWPRPDPHDITTWTKPPICPKCEAEANRIDKEYMFSF